MSLISVISIGFGGFLGAVARYCVTDQVSRLLHPAFPYGTLIVNAAGSFLLGFLSRFLLEHPAISEPLRTGLLIGFLGAFTTFSTFSHETVLLLQEGDFLRVGANIAANVFLCLFLCFIGLQLAKTV